MRCSWIPVLTVEEVRTFIAGIDTGTPPDLRDSVAIGLRTSAGCSAQAAVGLTLSDVVQHDGRMLVRL